MTPVRKTLLLLPVVLLTVCFSRTLCAEDTNAATQEEPRAADDGSSDDAPSDDNPSVEIRIESGFLGKRYTNDLGATRLLVLRLSVTNRRSSRLTLARSRWQLKADHLELGPVPLPEEIQGGMFFSHGQRVRFRDAAMHTLRLAPGENATTWLTFLELPQGSHIPDMELRCVVTDSETIRVELNEHFEQQLKLDIRRLGPADALAYLKIDGALNTISLGSLMESIDQLAADRVSRFVIAYGEKASTPDPNVAGWLRQTAVQSGRSPVINENFPPFPSRIVDFRYVEFQTDAAAGETDSRRVAPVDPGDSNVHQSVVQAVSAAIGSVCALLPREPLLETIRHGDELSKSAVLRHSGEKLAATDLSLILRLTSSESQLVAMAAAGTLRHFPQRSALDRLQKLATESSDDEVRRAALRSLAGSRYAVAHQRLITLAQKGDDTRLRALVAQAMAAEPRPVWTKPLLSLFQNTDDSTRVDVLLALAELSPPELLGLLERSLESSDSELSGTALDILISQNDPRAEQITSQWVTRRLQVAPPSPKMHDYLRRTHDPSAVPYLMQHLSDATDRRELLKTILAIGDQRVVERVAADSDEFEPAERVLILRALQSVRSEEFQKRATRIAGSRSVADEVTLGLIRLLESEGTDHAVELLTEIVDRLQSADEARGRLIAAACSGLSAIGTHQARTVLREIVQEGGPGAETADSSLQNLYHRSPAYRYVNQGLSQLSVRDNAAAALIAFNAAVETDPGLPAARRHRGNAFLRLPHITRKQLKTAHEDFSKFVELEPEESEGHTGLALAHVRLGKIDAAMKAVSEVEDKFSDDPVYLYNTACVYGRAIEQLEAASDEPMPGDKSLPATEKTIARYRGQGVAFLRRSIKNGLDDQNFEWMRQDPDLATIRQSPEFEPMLQQAGAADEAAADRAVQLPEIPAELDLQER